MTEKGYRLLEQPTASNDVRCIPDSPSRDMLAKKEDVAKWLTTCPDADVHWVFQDLQLKRPGVFPLELPLNSPLNSPRGSDSPAQPRTSSFNFEMEHGPPSHAAQANLGTIPAGKSIVQFSSSVYYCTCEDAFIELEVIRIGNNTAKAEVAFETIEGSAKHKQAFISSSGIAVFQPGETFTFIKIPICNNGRWDTTLEFEAELKEPSNSILGDYLYHARVKIIDSSTFPSEILSDQRDESMQNLIDNVSARTVRNEFFTMVWKIPAVRKGTMWCLFVGLVHNLWYFVNLFLTAYLIGYVVNKHEVLLLPLDRIMSLRFYGGLAVLSVASLHALDYSKTNAKMGGARTFVQNAIIRKFLHYTDYVRSRVSSGDVTMGIDRDAPLAAAGYMSCLSLVFQIEKLAFMVLYKFVAPNVFGTRYDAAVLLPIMVFPLLLSIFLRLREKVLLATLIESNECQERLRDDLSDIVDNFAMIGDYSRHNFATDQFHGSIRKAGAAAKCAKQVMLNTLYFPQWVSTLVVAIYVVIGGEQVLNGDLNVGTFVVNLKIFDATGNTFEKIFEILADIQGVHASIMKLFYLLNLETDVSERMELNRQQQKDTSSRRQDIVKKAATTNEEVVAVDILPIVMNLPASLGFQGSMGSEHRLNLSGYHEIKQGQLVAFVGRSQAGKRTLLHLLAGRTTPGTMNTSADHTTGVFCPAHLRITTVSENSVFSLGTLFENLTYGMDPESPGAARERVVAICNKLGIDAAVHAYFDQYKDWTVVLSEAQRKLINIARALIVNSEVICLHKPMAKLDHRQPAHVLRVIHEHIEEKGLAMASDAAMRRPRTVLMSSSNILAVLQANTIYNVARDTGVSKLSHDEATEIYTKGLIS